MTDPTPSASTDPSPVRSRSRIVVLAGLAGLALGIGGVYALGGFGGNAGSAGKCEFDAGLAGRLAARAVGEVAAFAPSRAPLDLSRLAFSDGDGRPVRLSDRHDRVVLLNLWATWCAPCRAEMPALDRLQRATGGPDFEVVAVNLDQHDPEKPRRFREETGIAALTAYADPSLAVFRDLQRAGLALGLPTTILVSRRGCTLGVMAGPAAWDGDEARALIGEALR